MNPQALTMKRIGKGIIKGKRFQCNLENQKKLGERSNNSGEDKISYAFLKKGRNWKQSSKP